MFFESLQLQSLPDSFWNVSQTFAVLLLEQPERQGSLDPDTTTSGDLVVAVCKVSAHAC